MFVHPTFRWLCVLGALSVLSHTANASARVVISEVHWAGSDLSTADEWVELVCVDETEETNSEEAVEQYVCDVGNWTLTSVNSQGVEQEIIRFATGTVLGAGEYVLLSNFSEEESRIAIMPQWVTSDVSLPNTKLLLRLRDASGAIVDAVDDGVGDPFAGINQTGTGTKASMERIDLFQPGTLKENWVTAQACINLDFHSPVLATPGVGFDLEAVCLPDVSSSSSSSSSSTSSISSSSSTSSTSSTSSSSPPSSTSSSSLCPPSYETAILIQSGPTRATGKITINLQATGNSLTALGKAQCHWDYADAFQSDSCNPPVHTIDEIGTRTITLDVRYACGLTERATLAVEVLEQSSSAPSSIRSDASSSVSNTISSPSPRPSPSLPIVLSAVLPNPKGKDQGFEWMEVQNLSRDRISLDGWMLSHNAGGSPYVFSGVTLKPSESRRFTDLQTRIVLRNAEDEARLLSPDGSVHSMIAWSEAREGKIYRPAFLPTGSIRVRVVRVIDGDTFDMALLDTEDPDLPPSVLHRWRAMELKSNPAIRVRLIGIDAPERSQTAYGEDAYVFTKELLEGKNVDLLFEPDIWDTYERLLAYVTVPESEELLQKRLLEGGYARVDRRFSFSQKELGAGLGNASRV